MGLDTSHNLTLGAEGWGDWREAKVASDGNVAKPLAVELFQAHAVDPLLKKSKYVWQLVMFNLQSWRQGVEPSRLLKLSKHKLVFAKTSS